MSNCIKIVFSFVLVATAFNFVSAQETKSPQKKVIIVKKTDKNGKISETRTEAEGAEAEELLKNMSPEDIDVINIVKGKDGQKVIKIRKSATEAGNMASTKQEEKEVEITSTEKDGKRVEKYKIIKKDGDKEKVIEWDGEGEMPEDLKKELGNIDIKRNFDGKNMEITVEGDGDEMDNNEERVFIARGDRDRRKNRMEWINDNGNTFFPRGGERAFNFKSEKPNNNKASLGVMIEDTDNGVTITDMVEGSAAAAAGLRRGDVILKINNKYIFTANGLVDALTPYNPNEKVKLRYLREGNEKAVDVSLKARN